MISERFMSKTSASTSTPVTPTTRAVIFGVPLARRMIKYVLRKTKAVILLLFASFLLWGLLTTTIHELNAPFVLNKIPRSLQNKRIQLLIAHPDDEVMFFAPSLIELSRPDHNNTISATCLSTGNDQGLGSVRENELYRSFDILGIQDRAVINDESKFKDSMTSEWDPETVAAQIEDDVDVILTFDEFGISNHPNHISCYKGAILSGKSVFALKTWTTFEKYSATVYTNIEIILRIASTLSHLIVDNLKLHGLVQYIPIESIKTLHNKLHKNIHIFADLPSSILGVAAMTNGHHTQMVWFRWGWLTFSKYSNSNELIQIN